MCVFMEYQPCGGKFYQIWVFTDTVHDNELCFRVLHQEKFEQQLYGRLLGCFVVNSTRLCFYRALCYANVDWNNSFPHSEIGLEVLAVQRVSKAQAWQRTGRAGREDSGICYRLYTEDEFEKFDKMTVPEIQRWERGGKITNIKDLRGLAGKLLISTKAGSLLIHPLLPSEDNAGCATPTGSTRSHLHVVKSGR